MTPMQEPDPGRDYQTIAGHLAPVAFPWDSTRALELALFRTFAATRFGGLLHGSVPGGRRARDERDEQEVERMTTRMMARLTARAGNQTALATVLRKTAAWATRGATIRARCTRVRGGRAIDRSARRRRASGAAAPDPPLPAARLAAMPGSATSKH